jgi:hypothetical protein
MTTYPFSRAMTSRKYLNGSWRSTVWCLYSWTKTRYRIGGMTRSWQWHFLYNENENEVPLTEWNLLPVNQWRCWREEDEQGCVGNVCIYGFSPRVYTTLDQNRPNTEWDSKGRIQTIFPMPLTETKSVWKHNQKFNTTNIKDRPRPRSQANYIRISAYFTKIHINVMLASLVFQTGQRSLNYSNIQPLSPASQIHSGHIEAPSEISFS